MNYLETESGVGIGSEDVQIAFMEQTAAVVTPVLNLMCALVFNGVLDVDDILMFFPEDGEADAEGRRPTSEVVSMLIRQRLEELRFPS